MKTRDLLIVLGACLVASSQHAGAYELATHARLTQAAFNQSTLSDLQVIRDLGLDPTIASPLGNEYFDISGTAVATRLSNPFEEQFMPLPASQVLTLPAWLMRGAIREDDFPGGPNPWFADPDKPVPIVRVLNHFFDPVNLWGLTANGHSFGMIAPQWAIGSADVFATPNVPNTNRRNHYTVFDAREAEHRALTGQDKDGNPVASSENDRKKYWATTFRSLGNVVHLLQDMAQPQHTRNDPHSGVPGYGHKSVYEVFAEARATGNPFVVYQVPFTSIQTYQKSAFGVSILQYPTAQSPLIYGGYSVPAAAFSDFLSFYTTIGTDSINKARGLADYSNRGFFSAGTNLGHSTYVSPSSNPNAYTLTKLNADWQGQPLTQNAPVTFLNGIVPDTLDPKSQGGSQPFTSYSIWDQFLVQAGSSPTYSLNRYNYDAMADLLIPRAVAYSAGLINYFFRGKLEITVPKAGVYGIVDTADPSQSKGFSQVRLQIRNLSPIAGGQAQDMNGGTLRAVAKYHLNACFMNGNQLLSDALSVNGDHKTCRSANEYISVSAPQTNVTLAANAKQPTQLPDFDFSAQPIPLNAIDLYLQVVYRGPLGNEQDAVAVTTKDIAEPTFVSYHNDSDYSVIEGHVYTRDEINKSNDLLMKVQPRSCVDKGQLKDGCLEPFDISQEWVGSDGSELFAVNSLSVRNYVHVAMLMDPTPEPQMTDLIGECQPATASVKPSVFQLDTAANTFRASYLATPWRGLHVLFNLSCVNNGDGSIPGQKPDDRSVVFGKLNDTSVSPTRVTISF